MNILKYFLHTHLQGSNGSALETQVSLEILSNLPHQALEGQLTDQQLSGLLVPTDLSQGYRTRPETHNPQL